jgi:translation initiation factor IF-1
VPADTDVMGRGVISDVLPGSKFKVRLENGHEITAYLSGKMRKFAIKVVLGDRVQVAMSTYDLSQGRITRRD